MCRFILRTIPPPATALKKQCKQQYRGVSVFPFSPGSPSAHRLSLKDDLRHWNKWEKSSSLGIPTFSAGTAGTKALWLCIHIPKARASAISNFCASLWRLLIFLTIFRKIHQNSTFAQGIVSAYLWPKNPISGGLGAPNPNFVLQIRGKRKQFWGIFIWGMEDLLGLPSLKIWERSNKKWGRN